jgi:organic hydroperoxide reductase OsmC/OhrA
VSADANGAHVHHYIARCSWRGSTGGGYESYDRGHDGASPPADGALALSADPAFRGDPSRLNPEQLLVLAAVSCQLLSFLTVAARARIDVHAYDDTAEAVMPETDRYPWITEIVLRPRITVAPGPSEDRIRHLCEVAHRECYIANSVRTEIRIEPEIIFADAT